MSKQLLASVCKTTFTFSGNDAYEHPVSSNLLYVPEPPAIYMMMATNHEMQRWRPLDDSELAAAARRIALDVAGRLRDPAQVEAAVVEASLQSNIPNGPQWAPYGLAQGYAGLALLWEQLDRCFPGEGWDTVAYEHLEIAAHGAATEPYLMPSAFGSLGGLAFVACYLARSGSRYQRLLATLEQKLISKIRPMTSALIDQCDGVPVNVYDVISGLSGVALYLLTHIDSPEAESTLKEVVRCLVELSREENGLPRWHTPARFLGGDEIMLRQFPHGYLNCGLAHGIPGPLGAMSLARRAGVTCDGLEDAIDRLVSWLVCHRLDDIWGINWPTGVGLLPPEDPAGMLAPVDTSPLAQAGWCYGSPGVARVLYLAGLALRRPDYCDLAISAIRDVLRRPVRARHIESPTFCHGVSGLLAIVMRFANDTGDVSFRAGAAELTRQLLSLYEPASLLGFRSIELEGKRVDQPGLLDGASGVALVLLGAGCDVAPAWDRIFLLS